VASPRASTTSPTLPDESSTPTSDRLIVAAALVAITALAWLGVFRFASATGIDARGMAMTMADGGSWSAADFLLTFLMWAVMMVAMMTPAAAATVLVFARVDRQRQRTAERSPFPATMAFLAGYLVVWTAFSVFATLFQWGLHSAAVLSPEIVRATPRVAGVLLLMAGAYQLTPLKDGCLSRCRSPVGFLLTEWREGSRGALVMGIRHGRACVGCCWLVMTLLFVAGVMNLLWIAIIAVFVLAERAAPAGQWVGRAMGAVAIAVGAVMLIRGVSA